MDWIEFMNENRPSVQYTLFCKEMDAIGEGIVTIGIPMIESVFPYMPDSRATFSTPILRFKAYCIENGFFWKEVENGFKVCNTKFKKQYVLDKP